jgi:hypothetical protein
MLYALKRIYQRIFTFNKFLSVIVETSSDGDLKVKGCSIQLQKDNTFVEQTFIWKTVEDFVKQAKKAQVVVLLLQDERILTKIVSSTGDEQPNILLNRTFPGISLENLYFQYEILPANQAHVSIIRKEYLNEVFKWLDAHKIAPYFISLSPLTASLEISSHEKPTLVQVGSNFVEFANGYPVASRKANISGFDAVRSIVLNADFGTANITHTSLPFFSSVFKAISAEKTIFHNAQKIQDYRQNTLSALLMLRLTFLIGGFSLAMIGMLFGTNLYYKGSKQRLDYEVTEYKATFGSLSKHLTESAKRDTIALESSILALRANSFVIDQISASIPSQIRLTSLELYPRHTINRQGDRKAICKVDRAVLVKGTCDQVVDLDQWLGYIRDYKWVRQAELIKVETNSLSKTVFEVKIDLSEEDLVSPYFLSVIYWPL